MMTAQAFLLLASSVISIQALNVTYFPHQSNIIGPNLLQRLPGTQPTISGDIPQNGPAAVDLGTMADEKKCVDECLQQFPDTCFSATFYAADSSQKDFAGKCFAVNTSYYDWFPAFDRLGERKVTSARVWRGCKTDGDCAYNGKCSQSSCVCKSGWKGPACTELDLLPTLNGQDAGYNYVDTKDGQNVSSWGGVPLLDESTGIYHMWVSHFTNHCGIIAWGENSIILHTTSKAPLGPYVPANGTIEDSLVFPVFSHEPDVKRGPNGEWVMFFSHHVPNTGRPQCSCANGVTPDSCHDKGSHDPTAMSWASSPWGPWSSPVIVIENTDSDSNLSPLIRADGSLIGLWRSFKPGGPSGWAVSSLHLVAATDWKDPSTYKLQSNWQNEDLFNSTTTGPLLGPTEDPWIYEADDYRVHAIFHNMYGCYACCGHAYTEIDPDVGLRWTYTGADACGPYVEHADGSTTVLGRRERPHLLLDPQKRPVMLTNGVTVCPTSGDEAGYCPDPVMHDRSWTLAQPIRVE